MKVGRAALLAVILIEALAAIFVAGHIIAYRHYPFDSDEASHANGGLALALDLRAGDWRAFAIDSYQQDMYPPAFSWLEAAAFLMFGASPLVARMCSLACLLAAALVLYALGVELDEKWGWLGGLAAVIFTLTAHTMLVHSALAMLEVPGVLVSMAALWGYLRAIRHPTAPRFALTSVLMALTVLTKYPYGVVTVPAIVCAELIWACSPANRVVRPLVRRWLGLFGPFALAMLIWFAQPYKVAAFFEYATLQPQQVALFSIENLVYYPRSIALHFTPAPLWSLLILAGVVWAMARWRDERARLLLIYFVLGMLVMTVKLQKNPRFIATIVPAAYLLTGAMLAWLATRLLERGKRACVAMLVVTLALALYTAPVLIDRLAAFPLLMRVEYETDPRAAGLAAWVAAHAPPGQRVYFVNPWDQFSPLMVGWFRATHNAPPGVRWEDVSAIWTFLPEPTPEAIEQLERDIRASGALYVAALEGGPEGQQVWGNYARAFESWLVPIDQQEFSIEQWKRNAAQWLKSSLLTRAGLERVASESHYTMHIVATLYRVAEP